MSLASQAIWPALAFTRLHDFPLNSDFRARVGFLHGSIWYVGAQWTAVAGDLLTWDWWRYGRVTGPGSSRTVPDKLSVSGMTLDETDKAAPIAALASGSGLIGQCGTLYGASNAPGAVQWRVYRGTNGALSSGSVAYTGNEAQVFALPTLANGSHMLWVRFAGITLVPLTDEQYEALTGVGVAYEYEYEEGGETYFWDWRRNLGRLPSDLNNEFYGLRADLLDAGAQQDRPDWATYITSASPQDGEWSCLRLQVGGGTFAIGVGIVASPGPALYSKDLSADLEDAISPVLFDVAARSVSASTVKRNGNLLVAGNRASRSGPQLALWEFDGTTWELLGVSDNLSNGQCECALSSHDCGTVLEAADGEIYVLSKCSLHRFEANSYPNGLKDFPASTGGHPGGQCLQELSGALYWMTEYFGNRDAVANGTAQFYNTLESLTLAGQGRSTGTGTVCHGPNALTLYRGGLTGVVQDQPFSISSARGRVAVLQGQQWTQEPPSWPASAYLMQGVETAQGRLIVTGVEANSELPLAAVLDPGGADGDGSIQFARFRFRLEKATRVVNDGREQIVVIGKEVVDEDADLDSIPYTLLVLPFDAGTPFIHFCLHWDGTDRFRIDLASLPEEFDPVTSAAFLRYQPMDGGPGYWAKAPATPDPPRLTKHITGTHFEYVLTGTPPYNFDAYDKICITLSGDGAPWMPEPTCTTAACVIPQMPVGTKITVIEYTANMETWALQIDDVQEDTKPLARCIRDWPCLWLCLNQDAATDDPSAYDVPVRRVDDNGRINLPRMVLPGERVRVMYLWPPTLDSAEYVVTNYSVNRVE